MNKKFLFFSFYMSFCAFLSLWFWLSPVSRSISEGRSFALSLVAYEDEKNLFPQAWLLVFEPSQRKYRLTKPIGKIKLSGSFYNKAYEARRRIEGKEPIRESFFYARLPKEFSPESLSSFAGEWRKDFNKLSYFTKSFFYVFSRDYTNFNLPDKLSLYFEILRAKPLDFSYEEAEFPSQDEQEVSENNSISQEKIKIRFVDASGKKRDLEKTFSFLRQKGFDPVDFKKIKPRKKTEIISYSQDISAARRLAGELGVKNYAIKIKKEKYNIYTAEIIAGEDFTFLK